jgi:hypothetical protein
MFTFILILHIFVFGILIIPVISKSNSINALVVINVIEVAVLLMEQMFGIIVKFILIEFI